MKRFEFIMDQSIAEDFFSLCQANGVGNFYTRTERVIGRGNQNPRMGDNVWPQSNTCIMIVAPESQVPVFERIVQQLRQYFPAEGVFCCCTDCQVL